MIKAEELMLDDWVLAYGKKTQVVWTGNVKKLAVRGFPSEFFEDEILPIPITPEILEKNGFIKSTPPPGIHARCYELNNKKDRYNLTIADYNKYKRLLLNVDSEDSECFNIKCDYVHQLQHALKLCGITKNIEL